MDAKFYHQHYPYQQTVVTSAAVLGGSSPDLVNISFTISLVILFMVPLKRPRHGTVQELMPILVEAFLYKSRNGALSDVGVITDPGWSPTAFFTTQK